MGRNQHMGTSRHMGNRHPDMGSSRHMGSSQDMGNRRLDMRSSHRVMVSRRPDIRDMGSNRNMDSHIPPPRPQRAISAVVRKWAFFTE